MTAINLPGQLEVQLVVDHSSYTVSGLNNKTPLARLGGQGIPRDVQIAKLLCQYEERPTSETWSRIQELAKEILR